MTNNEDNRKNKKIKPYHRRYHKDELWHTRSMTLEERGAYTTIVDMIHMEGEAIERDERYISGQMSCSLRKTKAMIDRLIELRKLYMTADGRIAVLDRQNAPYDEGGDL